MPDIEKLSNHLIVCGFSKSAQHIVDELDMYKKDFAHGEAHSTMVIARNYLVIDQDPQVGERLKEKFGYAHFLCGDATDDDILEEARIDKAYGIFTALPNERDNLFIAFTARQKNAKIKIVSRTADIFNIGGKLRKAGANSVVSPNFIGGLRMVSELIRPDVTDFLDEMLRNHASDVHIEEIKVGATSRLCGKTLHDLHINDKYNMQVIATMPAGEKHYTYNPDPKIVIKAGDVIVVFGTGGDIYRFGEAT